MSEKKMCDWWVLGKSIALKINSQQEMSQEGDGSLVTSVGDQR